jgi:hypothetical protein
MPTTPSIEEVWQDTDDEQPTCYQARNPVAPWRAAESQLTEDFEDIEFAREYVTTGGQCGAPLGRRTASPPPAVTPVSGPSLPAPARDLSLSVLQQLKNTLPGSTG